MTETGAEFWTFSLAFYGRTGVSQACIALQDRQGRDVNLTLYLCWVGLSGRGRLVAGDLAREADTITPWRRAVIEPLRAARRALKAETGTDIAALYEQAKAVELAAERAGQQRLALIAPPPAPRHPEERAADAAANLLLYLDDAASRALASPILRAIEEPVP